MIKVLIVDDSAVVRRVLSEALAAAPGIEVVGTAVDPYAARDKIAALSPDVITLDVEMPRMDGVTFLEKLMQHHPLPVVMVSSLTPSGSALALKALAFGAVGIVCKPGSQFSVAEVKAQVVEQVRIAAQARVRPLTVAPSSLGPTAKAPLQTTRKVLALAASTGGPQAIEHVLCRLPAGGPGVVVVQHMPRDFTADFARRLDTLCASSVSEARDGDELVAGRVLIAPGGVHMVLQRSGATYAVRLKDAPPVNNHRPSADVLLYSVAKAAGDNAVGVVMTGMGNDGARGLLAMREAGAYTIAQDQESSVVYGMPRAARELDAATQVVPLDEIASAARAAFSEQPLRTAAR